MRPYILPILAVVSVLLYISTLVGRTGPEPLFRGISKDSITEIEIKKGSLEYLLKRTDSGWVLQKPIQWPADSEKVNRLIETALKTRVENPITDKEKDFDRYKVSDNGDYITLKTPSKSITVFVGKRGPRYSLVYIREKGEDDVYLVNAAFADELPTGRNSFRDRTIWKITKNSIIEIQWQLQKKTFGMIKTQKKWITREGKPLPEGPVDAYIAYLSDLKASGFPETDQLPEGASRVGKLILKTKDNKTYTLSLYKDSKDNYYLLYRDHLYKTYDYQKDQIFRQIKPE